MEFANRDYLVKILDDDDDEKKDIPTVKHKIGNQTALLEKIVLRSFTVVQNNLCKIHKRIIEH